MKSIALATLLREVVPDMVPSGVDRWGFPLERGARESVVIHLVPYWASFGLVLPKRPEKPLSLMAAIERQSAWPGNVKFVTEHSRLALVRSVRSSSKPLLIATG